MRCVSDIPGRICSAHYLPFLVANLKKADPGRIVAACFRATLVYGTTLEGEEWQLHGDFSIPYFDIKRKIGLAAL